MYVPEVEEKLMNVRKMADNLMACPANEQFIGEMQAVVAQALRDLADAVHQIRYYGKGIDC